MRTVQILLAALAAGAPAAAQVVYLGGEIPVNTTAAGAQVSPALAAGSTTGRFFVAWQSFDQDGSGAGVYGRTFEADGTPLGAETRLNTTTAGDQITPAVASRYDLFKAVWASQNKDGDGYGIVLRLFDWYGEPIGGPYGGELVVNQTTAGSQIQPDIAMADSGFVVVWTGPNPAAPAQTEIWARRFALNGQALSGEFRVNAATSGNQLQPAVAMAADGSFLVVWASDQGDGSGYGVFARRFDAAGNATTSDLLLPTNTLYDQNAPAAVALAAGGYAVAWQSALQAGSSAIGPQPIILAQRLDGGGQKVGPDLQVTPETTHRQEAPALAAESSGGFVVGWQASDVATGDTQSLGRRFDAVGTPLTGEFPLHTTGAGDQSTPALAALPGGRFVATWSSFGQDGSSWGIFAQRFGTPLQPCIQGPYTLCLNDGRFQVTVAWATALGTSGQGQAVPLTADTGYFWFFNEENVEIVIKVLEACTPFGNYWVFAGGLTNVEATIVVTDTDTGESRAYGNPLGTMFQPIQDAGHFFVCSGVTNPPDGARTAALAVTAAPPANAATTACVANAETLCLNDGRFEVTTDWTTFQGQSGAGQAVALTPDTGYFWFFGAANVEMVIKVLDGCFINGSFWVYAGGLTDVLTNIRVRDTVTDTVWERTNPQQTPFQPIQDVNAFPVCP